MAYSKKAGIFYLVYFTLLCSTAFSASPLDAPELNQLNESEKNMIMALAGSAGAGGFSWAKVAAYVIFNAIGFVAFVYGKKNSFGRPMIIGVVLMVYPYFVPGTFALYVIGAALTAALYFWRD